MDAHPLARTYLQGYSLPASEVKAYAKAERHIPLLSFFVPVSCLVSCIPMGFAWTRSDVQSGRVGDPNFYQLIAGSILQLLSLAALVCSTVFHAKLARLSWLLTWILVAISASCTLSNIPLYLLSPTAWSMIIAFSGNDITGINHSANSACDLISFKIPFYKYLNSTYSEREVRKRNALKSARRRCVIIQ